MGWHMFGNYGYFDGSWMFFGSMFMMILFPLILVGLFVWIVYEALNKREDESAEKIAKERYAKGEITQEEYEDILKNLKK